jgi:hypothetical protein
VDIKGVNSVDKVEKLSFFNDLSVNKSGDKSRIIAKKPKTIRIRTDESIIESNLSELPFVYYYKQKDPINILEYIWYDSKGIFLSITIFNQNCK